MIARVTHSSVTVRRLVANLHRAAEPIEAALAVYKRYRRSVYERVPLLAALSHAGYYEDRSWGAQYGDEALDACEDLTGAANGARHRALSRAMARPRPRPAPRVRALQAHRRSANADTPSASCFFQLFGAVTAITGTAALSLDVERATRVANALAIFSVLPEVVGGRAASTSSASVCARSAATSRRRPARRSTGS